MPVKTGIQVRWNSWIPGRPRLSPGLPGMTFANYFTNALTDRGREHQFLEQLNRLP